MRDRAPLRVVELQPAFAKRFHLKQRRHDSSRLSDFNAKGKPREALLYRVENLLPRNTLVGGNKTKDCVESPMRSALWAGIGIRWCPGYSV
jgi:hypothetical protein